MEIRVEDLRERTIDDRISVCGESQPVDQASIRQGISEKKRWLRRMLRKVGPPSKILYVDGKPAGQIQYFPETSIPYLKRPDPRTLRVMCGFVHKAYQGKGFGSVLFKSLLADVKRQGRYERLDTLSFDPPGYNLTQTQFWKKMGFQQRPGGLPNQLQCPIRGELTQPRRSKPKRVKERGVKVFYEPTCIFGPYFEEKTLSAIREIDPKVNVQRINMWERPEIAMKRRLTDSCVYINGRPMKHSIFEVEEFKKEATRLLKAA